MAVSLVICSVCQETLNPADGNVARTPCSLLPHEFHVDCIKDWARTAFESLSTHLLCNMRNRTHEFTFEVGCPNCREPLNYRVNLLATDALLPNGGVVPNFPMEFDAVEVLDTSGQPIPRANPTPLQQEIEEAIRDDVQQQRLQTEVESPPTVNVPPSTVNVPREEGFLWRFFTIFFTTFFTCLIAPLLYLKRICFPSSN